MRSNAANALEQSRDGVAGSAASVGKTLGAEMVRAGVDPSVCSPKTCPQQDEDSEDETIVDETINQESDDDEFIQTVITKTRKRVRSLRSLADICSSPSSAEDSRSHADPDADCREGVRRR
jgi:hypothetical protein